AEKKLEQEAPYVLTLTDIAIKLAETWQADLEEYVKVHPLPAGPEYDTFIKEYGKNTAKAIESHCIASRPTVIRTKEDLSLVQAGMEELFQLGAIDTVESHRLLELDTIFRTSAYRLFQE